MKLLLGALEYQCFIWRGCSLFFCQNDHGMEGEAL